MGDAENTLPPAKKRAAGREISRDNPGLDDEEDSSEQENGTFKRAKPTITPDAPSGAPESRATTAEVTTGAPIVDEKEVSEDGKNVVNKSEKNEGGNNQQSKKTDEKDQRSTKDKGSAVENEEPHEEANDEELPGDIKTKDEDKKDDETANADNKDKSSENADSTKEFVPTAFNSVPLFGLKNDQPFGSGLSTNGNSSLFNASGTSVVSKREGTGFQAMPEVPIETGEENEKVVFSADSVLFEFIDGAWKERGKGELKVNVSTAGMEGARVLMRARGNYRLILNARLYPDMKLTNMDKRGITFACMNTTGEEKEGCLHLH
ncbi:hypothetical protein V6N13_132851 [Hibiscus sabdariffa]|uniref:RanBD1 domain-containing protein n=1 Tax=Hibiscus sabdariffa TaxID=183260 RepID=A0ABR2PWG5_9ROSI